jgi:glycosyltransferase involved in cell wall biosynthesis
VTHQVLHILDSAGVEGSAIARVVSHLALGLDPRKYALHAWFLGADGPLAGELREQGLAVRVLPWSRSAGNPSGALAFAAALRGQRFSIVHQHVGGRLVSWLARGVSGAALVMHLHTRVLEESGMAPALINVPGADAVIAVSSAVARCVPQARVVYTGVAVAQQGRIKTMAPAQTAPVIGAACRLVPVKGLIHLIGAMALLREEFPLLRLEIAGEGPERRVIETEAEALGIRDSVRLMGWRRDLEPLFAGWDIFVLPSLDEALGIVVLEAMAAAVPVVASAVGGLPEVVEEGCTGWLVPPAQPRALAERLRSLLVDPGLRCAMGAAGRERVRQRFSIQAMADAVAAIYDEVMSARSRSQRSLAS